MDYNSWFTSMSGDDWELILYFFRIILPLITLILWIKNSTFTDMFDRLTTAITTVFSVIISYCYRIQVEEKESPTTTDNNAVKFHVTSKADVARGQKVSRRWLVSWKPLPENADQEQCPNVPTVENLPNGGAKISYFDPKSRMTFSVTTIQNTGLIQDDAKNENSDAEGIQQQDPGLKKDGMDDVDLDKVKAYVEETVMKQVRAHQKTYGSSPAAERIFPKETSKAK